MLPEVAQKRRRVPIVALLVTVVLLATACGGLATPASPEPATTPSVESTQIAAPAPSKLPSLAGQDLKFERISVEHGLSHSTVNCIL